VEAKEVEEAGQYSLPHELVSPLVSLLQYVAGSIVSQELHDLLVGAIHLNLVVESGVDGVLLECHELPSVVLDAISKQFLAHF